MRHVFSSAGEPQTIDIGRSIGALLTPGLCVGFIAGLGGGKTALIRGIAAYFNVAETVTSPTFTLVNEYVGDQRVVHMDLYRLKAAADLENIGWNEYLMSHTVVLVEWADRFPAVMDDCDRFVMITPTGSDKREIVICDEYPGH